jgi:hypothetical protein
MVDALPDFAQFSRNDTGFCSVNPFFGAPEPDIFWFLKKKTVFPGKKRDVWNRHSGKSPENRKKHADHFAMPRYSDWK